MKFTFYHSFLAVVAMLLGLCGSCLAEDPSELSVGLVVSQFSAELVAPCPFTATEPDGKTTEIDKGKYFIAVKEGKILLGDFFFSSGTVLKTAENAGRTDTVKSLPQDTLVKEKAGTGGADSPYPQAAAAGATQDPKPKGATGKASPQAEPPAGITTNRSHRLFSVNRQEYRGALQVYVTDDGKKMTIVNRVPLEYYVNSVLGPKSSPIWPDEAIKAQAVAVRSLAWYFRNYPESHVFAVRAAEPESFYGGVRNENKNITKVAAKTAGQVLYFDGSPAAAYTCESSGGMTVSAEEVLGKKIPYLQPVVDYDTDCPNFSWVKNIQVATISRILDQNGYKVGRLQGYRLSDSERPEARDRYPSGRIKSIYWQGELGSVILSGKEFADMLALSSSLFDVYDSEPMPDKLDVPIENSYGMEVGRKQIPIEIKGKDGNAWKSVIPGYHFLNQSKDETLVFKGKGTGSGLGLSKWGAKGMADEAPEKSENYYKTILQHYYPGTYLVSIY